MWTETLLAKISRWPRSLWTNSTNPVTLFANAATGSAAGRHARVPGQHDDRVKASQLVRGEVLVTRGWLGRSGTAEPEVDRATSNPAASRCSDRAEPTYPCPPRIRRLPGGTYALDLRHTRGMRSVFPIVGTGSEPTTTCALPAMDRRGSLDP